MVDVEVIEPVPPCLHSNPIMWLILLAFTYVM